MDEYKDGTRSTHSRQQLLITLTEVLMTTRYNLSIIAGLERGSHYKGTLEFI